MQLSIATLNILGNADRWPERQPLIADELARLHPDVMALQEVDFFARQERKLVDGVPIEYARFRAVEHDSFGNGLLVRRNLTAGGEVDGAQQVELGEERVALAVDIPIRPEGETARLLRMVTTHLHWVPEEPQKRLDEVRRLLAWLEQHAEDVSLAGTVIAGDLNATPDEPACEALRSAGFRSAYAMANGDEPDWTYPTPPTPEEVAVRPPSCIDYIWLFGPLGTISARTVFDQPAAHNRTLFPSDHLGIMATVEV